VTLMLGREDESSRIETFLAGSTGTASALVLEGAPGIGKSTIWLAGVGAARDRGFRGSTRSFTRFTDVVDETIDGRILNGFHFRTADVHGAWIGKKTAQWVNAHFFGSTD
jgi:hypothetical protein